MEQDKKENQQENLNTQTSLNPNSAETQYYASNSNNPTINTTVITEKKKTKDHKAFAIIALVTAIIPIVYWLFIFMAKMTESQSTSVGFSGDGFLAMMFYWSFIGYILPIITIIFAMLGLKSTLKNISIISLCLVGLHVIFYFTQIFMY